ncbi:MAG: hypothetical protein CMR00_06080 [[Chlorobium] sp. 445]|nr:MAG: hypothetical protein CMR00_06080 [[Chlorobium] sp. 445]
MQKHVLQTTLLLLMILAACQSSLELTDAEKAKFDPRLLPLISGQADIVESDYDVSTNKEGKKFTASSCVALQPTTFANLVLQSIVRLAKLSRRAAQLKR